VLDSFSRLHLHRDLLVSDRRQTHRRTRLILSKIKTMLLFLSNHLSSSHINWASWFFTHDCHFSYYERERKKHWEMLLPLH